MLPRLSLPPASAESASFVSYTSCFPQPGPGKGKALPRMMPLGAAGGCQTSRTDVVRTSGNRMPTGGPGTGGTREEQVTVRPPLGPRPARLLQNSSGKAGDDPPCSAGQDSGEAGDDPPRSAGQLRGGGGQVAQLSELRGSVWLRVSMGHGHVTREVYVLFGRK